jgi:hypothetical protein
MHVSSEDSLSLLSKWQTESTPVSIVFVSTEGVSFSFSGIVAEVTSTGIVVQSPGTCEFIIDLDGVANWEYEDSREAPSHRKEFASTVVSLLGVTFKTGGRCSITERKTQRLT